MHLVIMQAGGETAESHTKVAEVTHLKQSGAAFRFSYL